MTRTGSVISAAHDGFPLRTLITLTRIWYSIFDLGRQMSWKMGHTSQDSSRLSGSSSPWREAAVNVALFGRNSGICRELVIIVVE